MSRQLKNFSRKLKKRKRTKRTKSSLKITKTQTKSNRNSQKSQPTHSFSLQNEVQQFTYYQKKFGAMQIPIPRFQRESVDDSPGP